MTIKYAILKHWFYWLLSFGLLSLVYGAAYDSYELGAKVILLLLPVHMLYFYLIVNFVLPRFFFRDKYVKTFLLLLLILPLIAILYRVVEVFITDPYIYRFYLQKDSSFTWSKLHLSKWKQLTKPLDFANAVERSNTVVWICVTLRLFVLWSERKQVALQAELNFLKGQLHPHFLFNSLNNLYALSLENAPQAPGIILGLSNILRYVIYECGEEWVLLKRDINVLNDYIDIEKLRYEQRLELNVNISDYRGDGQISPLLMLPLVENAFKHGAAETTDIPWINIELHASGDMLFFKVSNSKPEQPVEHDSNPKVKGIGLLNLRKRLELLYPGKHTFRYLDEHDCFIAELEVRLLFNNSHKP